MKVLIIEDDPIFGDMLSMYLVEEQFEVLRVDTGQAGLNELQQLRPDMILLDLVLPDTDGMKLCAVIRELSNVPVIIISMNADVSRRIQALTAGADDYMCKPFSMQELKARMLAIGRRAHIAPLAFAQTASALSPAPTPAPQSPLPSALPPAVTAASPLQSAERIRLDLERRSVYIREELVETTFSEFEIMKLFYQHPGKVFSRDDLINSIRGIDSYVNERSIDVHVTNLRKKVEDNPKQPRHIKTVWGIGYKFMYP
ncbi:response regulator transcription factor [Paenibacillus koleovorans]|uniref:response regulator transcription factor n=1 Tax=Paenibacillus koleovorans TaxID=121608 RepID=UPI000FDBE152|nr:response regulator transcription factor [Paenibacillus koleovorans]